MCGRYMLTSPVDALRQLFRFEQLPNLMPRYNVAPTDEMPIVRRSRQGGRELAIMRWGLIPSWAKDKAIGARTINARADSLETRPAFREAFRKRRCLVLANGFYEWRREGKIKQPYLIRLKSGEPFGFAGLWEFWAGPAQEEIRSFTIVTTVANDAVAPLHSRMPVILDPDAYDLWLDPGLPLRAGTLGPCPAEWLESLPVSTRVNNVKHDDADCIVPAAVES
jgi:putative SOS response-associated peptidase YedK